MKGRDILKSGWSSQQIPIFFILMCLPPLSPSLSFSFLHLRDKKKNQYCCQEEGLAITRTRGHFSKNRHFILLNLLPEYISHSETQQLIYSDKANVIFETNVFKWIWNECLFWNINRFCSFIKFHELARIAPF